MSINEEVIKARSEENAKKAQQLPQSTQYAIIKVLPNILNSAFWGFDNVKNVQDHYDALKDDKNIICRKIGDQALIEVKPEYLLNVITMIDDQAIRQADLKNMMESQSKAHIDLERFLIRKGKSDGGFGGTVGIYCTNDVAEIRYKGTVYPAFRVGAAEALGYFANYNYLVRVGKNFVSAEQAFKSGQALWDSMKVSPTGTGVFIDIKYNSTPEQMKQFEAAYKKKYNVK